MEPLSAPVGFRDAFLRWLTDAQQFLQTHMRFTHNVRRSEPTENGYSGGWIATETDHRFSVNHHAKALTALPSTEAVLALVQNDSSWSESLLTWHPDKDVHPHNFLDEIIYLDEPRNPVPNPPSTKDLLFDRVLRNLLIAHWRQTGGLEQDIATFDRIFGDLAQWVNAPGKTPIRYVVWFWNLVGATEPVLLEPDIVLRPASRAEWDAAVAENGLFDSPTGALGNVPGRQSLGLILEATRRLDEILPEEDQTAYKYGAQLGRALTLGLRLFRHEWIGLYRVHVAPGNPFCLRLTGFLNSMNTWEYAISPQRRFVGGPYDLTTEIADRLVDLWPRLLAAIDAPSMAVAISRFGDAYDRTKPADRLIDYWIALESMFLRSSQKEDLTEIAASAISYDLGTNPADRDALYHDVKLCYAIRSNTVHGERPPEGKTRRFTVEWAEQTSSDIVRRALLKRLAEVS